MTKQMENAVLPSSIGSLTCSYDGYAPAAARIDRLLINGWMWLPHHESWHDANGARSMTTLTLPANWSIRLESPEEGHYAWYPHSLAVWSLWVPMTLTQHLPSFRAIPTTFLSSSLDHCSPQSPIKIMRSESHPRVQNGRTKPGWNWTETRMKLDWNRDEIGLKLDWKEAYHSGTAMVVRVRGAWKP